ncbi:unnamed protein product [Nesidiocoris tenuis]|uniref:Uncharacterized protein n=1 Tax=Nesidiocoris tenuis TaxID=355587 RepID=A0A6H5G641_9HEMI|nr:unnamed protein product [Nesidiocoris tenuis]
MFQVGSKGNKKGCFNLISSVAVGSEGQIVVADARIQVFSAKGDFQYEIQPDQKGSAFFDWASYLALEKHNDILSEKPLKCLFSAKTVPEMITSN